MTTLTASNPTRTFRKDDEVTIEHSNYRGQVWVISRVKQTKAIVKPKGHPDARGLDAPMNVLRHYDPTVSPMTVQEVPLMTIRPGEVVRLREPFQRNTTETLLVVSKVNPTTLTLDPLGGPSNGTPMRTSESRVVKVDLADILR